MDICLDVVKNLTYKVTKEVGCLCCLKPHVQDFENKIRLLEEKRARVLRDVEEARNRNETEVRFEVQRWIRNAELISEEVDTIMNKRLFGRYPNCIWGYRQGKILAKCNRKITHLIESCNFDRVAFEPEHPEIKYHSSRDYIDFESRKSELVKLVKALNDENCSMIGLYGMGGAGKTTLAVQIGMQVEESRIFEKVIFVVVSNRPNVRRIQSDILRQLNLHLAEESEEMYSTHLWQRILGWKRVLIILDDVWEKVNLKDIGIPCGPIHKSCCVLITTRDLGVLIAMGCQQTIELQTLTDQDALHLFVESAGIKSQRSFNEFMLYAKEIAHECGGLPIAIKAIARTLRGHTLREWKLALKTFQRSQPLHYVDEYMTIVYQCLSLSYDRLEKSAKDFLLLCSLFPEGHEISIHLLCKLSIGLGLFEEARDYLTARSMAIRATYILVSLSLLMGDKEEYVKIHRMVREMALWVSSKDLQVIMDSRTTVKSHIRFLFWSRDDFINQFDNDTKLELEILVLWTKGKVKVEDSYTIFEDMARLRVLFLHCESDNEYVTLSLKFLRSLMNIRALILDGWKLSDMSVLKILPGLEILELTNCLIDELPNEIRELKNLKSLGLRKCKIERNNPFEVIERCTQLEELDFLLNSNFEDWKEEGERENIDYVVPDVSSPTLTRFSIACPHLKYFDHDGNGMLNCFNAENVRNLISNAMFKNIVRTVEVLELGGIRGAGWKSLVPDIINPVEDGGRSDLVKLCLYSLVDMECLIDNRNHLYSDVTVFSNLDELCLDGVDVKELYRGPMISGFLRGLHILKLRDCKKLRKIFFDSNIKLPHLKVLHLVNCPIFQPSIFQSSGAQILEQLEELIISDFQELNSVIAYESMGDEIVDVDNKNSYSTLFPCLKTLEIIECGKLELISPVLYAEDLPRLEALIIRKCEKLKCVFGEYRGRQGRVLHPEIILPSLTKMILDIVPNFITIFQECKTDMQRSAPILKGDAEEKNNLVTASQAAFSQAHGDIANSNASLQDHTISSEAPVSMNEIQTFHPAQGLLRQPLNLETLRQLTIVQSSNLMSLFTLSNAKTAVMLEKLTIQSCAKLKHVIAHEEEEDYVDHMDCISIFPKLEELLIIDCRDMEFIFPPTYSVNLENLKFVTIRAAPKLKHVYGRFGQEDYVPNENENKALSVNFPDLRTISLTNVPKLIGICTNGRQLSLETEKSVSSQAANESEIEEIVQVERPMTSSVSTDFLDFHKLREIIVIECRNIKAMFSVSTWRSLSQLSKLCVLNCEEFVHLVDKDSKGYDYFWRDVILPRLEFLQIKNCNKLEFIFPSAFLKGLPKLKSMIVEKAADLKYIFGDTSSFFDDTLYNENEHGKLKVDLPDLETLSIRDVPNIINICARRYSLVLPSLRQINLDKCQELAKHSPDLTVYWKPAENLMKICRLTNLEVGNSRIDEVFNLERAKIKGAVTLSLQTMVLKNLSELKQICQGPNKSILSFYHLRSLKVMGCKRLRTIFSISIKKSLPNLFHLKIKDCEELVHIIEEDSKKSADDDSLELNFQKLEKVHIKSCNSLKFLFTISTPNMFPKLERLEIEEASELEQIFTCKQDNTQKKTVVKDAVPNLSCLRLAKLPNLVNIGWGIGFQTLQDHQVVDCPKYQEITHQQVQQEPQNLDLDNQATTEEPLSPENARKAMTKNVEEVPVSNKSSEATVTSSYTLKVGLSTEKTLKEIEAKESNLNLEKQEVETLSAKSLPRRALLDELKDEQEKNEPIREPQHQDLVETKTTIGIPEKTNTSLENDHSTDAISQERVQEVHISEAVECLVENIAREPGNMEPKLRIPTIYSEAGGSQSGQYPIIDKETGKGIDKAVHASKLPTPKTSQDFENDGKAMKKIVEVPISNKSTESIEANEATTQALEKQAFETSSAKSLPRRTSLHELKDEQQAMNKPIGQLQHQDHSTHSMSMERAQDGRTPGDVEDVRKTKLKSETIVTHQQQQGEILASVIENIARETGIMEPKPQASTIYSEPGGSKPSPRTINSETGKQVEGITIALEALVTPSSSNSKVDNVNETMGQSFQEYHASPEATITTQSANLEPRKQSKVSSVIAQSPKTGKEAEGIVVASQSPMSIASTYSDSTNEAARESVGTLSTVATPFDSTVQQTGHASVDKEDKKLENASNLNLPDVIPAVNDPSSQVGSASSALEILEIFDLVELKDGEAALLARALKQYPQLVLPCEQRTQGRMAFSYRVLVDILVILANKTPCTITTSEKSALKDNLCEATSLGFNKGWVDSVRTKVFDVDMSDVSSARERIQAMEAKLDTDKMLKQVQKEMQDARRDMEMAQSKFDAIDSKLVDLVEDRKTLTKLRNIISAKDTPFGI